MHHLKVLTTLVIAMVLFGCDGGSMTGSRTSEMLESLSGNAKLGSATALVDQANLLKIRKSGQPYPAWMKFRLPARDSTGGGAAFVPMLFGPPPFFPGVPLVYQYVLKNTKHNAQYTTLYYGPEVQYLVGVDFSNDLWIPQKNSYGQLITYEFRCSISQCADPIFQIPDTDGQPGAAAFDAKGGVYIENVFGTGGPGTGASIDVYAAGQTVPSTVLAEPNAYVAVDVALDAEKNVYMSWIDSSRVGHVDEFVGGQNPPISLPLTTGFIGGITVDGKGHLLVVDQSSSQIDAFSKPYGKSPPAIIHLGSYSLQCALNHLRSRLYCGDYAQGSVDVYKYDSLNPSLTAYQYSWTNGLDPAEMIQGVALLPSAQN
jgi:hypothetical protein